MCYNITQVIQGGMNMPKRKCFDVDELLPQNLVFFRKRAGLTQQQVADMLNINRTTYTKYETGSSEPGIEIIKRLAEIFDTDVSMLLEGDRSPLDAAVSDSFDDDMIFDKDIKELISFYNLLGKEEKEKVKEFIKDLMK